jgi:hypothetical protein
MTLAHRCRYVLYRVRSRPLLIQLRHLQLDLRRGLIVGRVGRPRYRAGNSVDPFAFHLIQSQR